MRTNMMGETFIHPEDDIQSTLDELGAGEVYVRLVEYVGPEDGPVEGWACEIADSETGESVAFLEGFEDEAAILDALVDAGIEAA